MHARHIQISCIREIQNPKWLPLFTLFLLSNKKRSLEMLSLLSLSQHNFTTITRKIGNVDHRLFAQLGNYLKWCDHFIDENGKCSLFLFCFFVWIEFGWVCSLLLVLCVHSQRFDCNWTCYLNSSSTFQFLCKFN